MRTRAKSRLAQAGTDDNGLTNAGCFPLCQMTMQSETSATNQGKMEQHCSKETKLPTGPKYSIYISTEILITPQ